ncbi:unnamed protein product [Paramecium sonneborni]|uniref:Uncharacterized protein n=1 Tax=Paramecium sonneborni TaxID=65129 RepID=A0A8S1RJF8_9CILI|nr:unnamed protein product [Paramecium sonneborni]
MHSLKQGMDDRLIYQPQLKPYTIISQNKLKRTNYLTIPSGYILSSYELDNREICILHKGDFRYIQKQQEQKIIQQFKFNMQFNRRYL